MNVLRKVTFWCGRTIHLFLFIQTNTINAYRYHSYHSYTQSHISTWYVTVKYFWCAGAAIDKDNATVCLS
jgi:hypothetical protein